MFLTRMLRYSCCNDPFALQNLMLIFSLGKMVVVNNSTKIYCCSNYPALEAKILAIFSLITSCACSFLLFLVYAHVQSQYLIRPINETAAPTNQTLSPLCALLLGSGEEYLKEMAARAATGNSSSSPLTNGRNSSNMTELLDPSMKYQLNLHQKINGTGTKFNNSTFNSSTKADLQSEDEYDDEYFDLDNDMSAFIMEHCHNNKTNSNKTRGRTALDSLANFMAWNKKTQQEWIITPFLWNGIDVLRAVLLLHAVEKMSVGLSKIWYLVTIVTCMTGAGITLAVLISSAAASFKITFTHIFIIILLYNIYALWIVYLFVKEIKLKNSSNPTSSPEDKENGDEPNMSDATEA